ncbi:hypothetical protein HAX54_049795 [Datura stramonium]|uniref:Uncharacterized protein n=1 Tax=Datura stramonium TaxID=4076 RepID=A0ABS8WKR5_DATST|nr:hypothetical protein [Datura stramonium]
MNRQRDTPRYNDYYPDLEEEDDAINYHMEDFQRCTQVPTQGTWRHNHGNQGRNYQNYEGPGYKDRDQGSKRTRGPPVTESRDAKIESILNEVPTKLLEQQMGMLSTQRPESDQCMMVGTRNGKTTIEIQVPGTGSTIIESDPWKIESKEKHKALLNQHIGVHDVLDSWHTGERGSPDH